LRTRQPIPAIVIEKELVLAIEETGTSEQVSALTDLIASGELTHLDGVMSPLTVGLVELFKAAGVDMTRWWSFTPQRWQCPACGRSKKDIVRLNNIGHLMCRLVEHHDHMRDLLLKRFREISSASGEVVADETAESFAKRSAAMVSSYDNTIVCDDCNVADANAKKIANTHADFSFSPQEISKFIKVTPNATHRIDAELACATWKSNKETFSLRLKIIDRIADIAASNEHWFQAQSHTHLPAHIESNANAVAKHYDAPSALQFLCGPKRNLPKKVPSAWRQIPQSGVSTVPTPGDIDHVAKVSCKRDWDKLPHDWSCPSCLRSKVAIVRPTNNNAWKLVANERNFWIRGKARNTEKHIVCSDCSDAAQKLGKVAAEQAEMDVQGYSKWVSLEELAKVVIGRAHARHEINNEVADTLVVRISQRICEIEASKVR
jgi:rubredoxin